MNCTVLWGEISRSAGVIGTGGGRLHPRIPKMYFDAVVFQVRAARPEAAILATLGE